MMFTDSTEAAADFAQRLHAARRVLILSHINPDGDAIGAMLGVWHMLQAIGKDAIPLASSPTPQYSQWLPGYDRIQVYEPGKPLPHADLVVLVDTATLSRIGPLYNAHAATLNALPLLVIDHHVTNEGEGAMNLIVPQAAATCEILYTLFHAMDVPISPELATCLLLGITTDTQSFQTSATRANTMRVAAELLEYGADHRSIVQQVYFALPASSVALIGLALGLLQTEHGIAWTTVTQEMMQITGAEDEAADEVVRMLQRIEGVRALVLFKERPDGSTKLSFRSTPPINVGVLAQRWGGGGHAQAAGATLAQPPGKAADEVLPLLRELVKG